MATSPSIIIQKIVSGGTLGGVAPSTSEVVSGEALTPTPAFNGVLTSFTTQLAKFPIRPGTLVISTGPGNTEKFTDNGDGTLTGDAGGSGTINYDTGAVGLTYFAAPGAGDSITGDYVTAGLEAAVDRQFRGRIWRWKEQSDGGLFESPVKLAADLSRELTVKNGGIAAERDVPTDVVGCTLRRVMFQGAGTTRVQGFLRDPWGALTVVSGESVTPKPAFNGSIKRFGAKLANGNVMQATLVLTTSGGGEVFTDVVGSGHLIGSNGGRGWLNHATGDLRLEYGSAPASGATLSASYKYGSGNVDYEFLDTDKSHSVSADVSLDPTSFTWSPPPEGGGNLIVPPGWQIRFISAGSLTVVGTIGIVCGGGMSYVPGQELPGLGVQE